MESVSYSTIASWSVTITRSNSPTSISAMTCSTPSALRRSSALSDTLITVAWLDSALCFAENTLSREEIVG